MTLIHVVNLTNGLLCPHLSDPGMWERDLRYSRIQSTHCEQKRWAQVVSGAGPDLLMNLALGNTVVVHDKSERRRETRACWQGLSFIRFACETSWDMPVTPIHGERGPMMEAYFRDVMRRIGEPTLNFLRYYRTFSDARTESGIHLRSCKME